MHKLSTKEYHLVRQALHLGRAFLAKGIEMEAFDGTVYSPSRALDKINSAILVIERAKREGDLD